MFGHVFGAVGVLIGRKGGKVCAPLKMNNQDGLRAVFCSWNGSGISPDGLTFTDDPVRAQIVQAHFGIQPEGRLIGVLREG